MTERASEPAPFRVLFVCTGNVCRSPAAELIFAREAVGHDIASASAGTAGLTGYGVDGPTALALKELGIDPSRHVARRLTPGLIEAADLVLTATTEHRSVTVQQAPLAFRRTFTLREFARLGLELDAIDGVVDADVLRARVAEVAEQRGWVEPTHPGGDDIADPFGAGLDLARSSVADVVTAVSGVLAVLGLSSDTAARSAG